MNMATTRRLMVSSPLRGCLENAYQIPIVARHIQTRLLSQSAPRLAEDQSTNSLSSGPSKLGELGKLFAENRDVRSSKTAPGPDIMKDFPSMQELKTRQDQELEEPHHFHVFATRHNTHITLTRPNRAPLISVSCGNLGFRHAGRKHYDSAFQLAGYVMKQILERGLVPEIKKLAVVLRGFGAGREAVSKALLGQEGRLLRNKIVRVSDATRLKFGGTRSKKPRRLG